MPQGCQECAQSLGTDQASHALSTFEENMTPPTEQPWHQRPSRGGVILGAEEAKGTESGEWSESSQASHWGSGASWLGGVRELSCVSLLCTHAPHSSCWTVSQGGVHTQDAMEVPPPPSGLSTRHPLIP